MNAVFPGVHSSCKEGGLAWVDAVICIYLTIPVLIFCTWFKPIFALILAPMLVYGAWQSLAKTQWKQPVLPNKTLTVLASIALTWVALGGTGHFFYANQDWVFRDAVLRDLSLTDWPPAYSPGTEYALLLRAPVGYYLPAALAGAIGGIRTADIALYLWTAFGFFLVLVGALTLFKSRAQRTIAVVLLLAFGGMDLVGYTIVNGITPYLGQHIEWWAKFAQYSSNSTLLFWAPNHAIPAWLATILTLRHWRQPELAKIAPLLGSCIPLWSPLAALGMLPFFLFGIDWRRDLVTLLSPKRALPSALLALICARYLTMGSEQIPGGWIFAPNAGIPSMFNLYALLSFLEFGILALLLARLKAFNRIVGLATVVLCLLPLYRFGYGNDIVMRASIPALLIFALASVTPLAAPGRNDWRIILTLVLGIGILGSIQEPIRAILTPRWPMTDMTLIEASAKFSGIPEPVTYVTRLTQPDMKLLLRDPKLVPVTNVAPLIISGKTAWPNQLDYPPK